MILVDLEIIYRTASILAISAAVIAACAGGIQWWTGAILAKTQEMKVETLEKEARIKNPTLFAQEIIELNVPDGEVFIQKYLVSISSPQKHTPMYTRIQYKEENGSINRIGETQMSDVGGGIKQIEGVDVSYVNTAYTIRTDRKLAEGESVIFSLKKPKDVPIENYPN